MENRLDQLLTPTRCPNELLHKLLHSTEAQRVSDKETCQDGTYLRLFEIEYSGALYRLLGYNGDWWLLSLYK